MSRTTEYPIAFARGAFEAGKEALADYSCPKSPHKFTQPQLFAMLVLKQFSKLDYRGTVTRLANWSELREALGLKRVPNYLTRCYAEGRLLGMGTLNACLMQRLLSLAEPFHREVLLYESGLLAQMPGGIAAPRLMGLIRWADDEPWIWLRDVTGLRGLQWPAERFAHSARDAGASFLPARPGGPPLRFGLPPHLPAGTRVGGVESVSDPMTEVYLDISSKSFLSTLVKLAKLSLSWAFISATVCFSRGSSAGIVLSIFSLATAWSSCSAPSAKARVAL